MKFPANFNSPYRAQSIIDFWQRWHMTLTRYINLYLFNPIALWITRRRVAQGKSVARSALATPEGFLSMLVFPMFCAIIPAGVWHGAGLTFLVYGLLHGTYLTINHAWRSFGPRISKSEPHPVQKTASTVGKIALTYFAVVVAQVVFRSATLHQALAIFQGMIGLNGFAGYSAYYHTERMGERLAIHMAALTAAYLVVWAMPNSLQILAPYEPTLTKIKSDSPINFSLKPGLKEAVALGVLGALVLLAVTGTTEFLYFRF
jgi:D-alanyl-lipoteichoic acid acyltransferase DltB (MBOAT superfamily)